MDMKQHVVVNVETGPGDDWSLVSVTNGWYYHANQYKHLVVQQRVDNSSFHREVTGLRLQVRGYV